MKVVFKSWWELLKLIFQWESLRQLLWVTGKTTKAVYVTFLTYFWWLVCLAILADYLESYLLSGLGWFMVLFFLFLTVRPSTRKKSIGYYQSYFGSHGLKFFIAYSLFVLLIMVVPIFAHFKELTFVDSRVLELLGDGLFYLWWPLHFIGVFPGYVNPLSSFCSLVPLIMPVFVFLMLFALDDRRGIRSLWRAFVRAYTMVWYTLPLSILSYLLFLGVSILVLEGLYPVLRSFSMIPSLSYSPWYVLMVLSPISVSFLTTIYTMVLYKDHKRYVKGEEI
ncbi:hypothetical protein JW872_03380 [Candidatus Babeliales bacterium]|nr:hypothetical protein [Candidatus Babeliales bacterium]